ncbi:transposase-like protein [Paenibacillus sp. FSL R7-269]|uniref:hypothetical protein n=1 Tax=Paenibacillus sp. FSL R7-269 TaxID=1226755 RepID=UPI0003E269EB|nr:hypothetical protein [Paenibacillus sp. FSL R7-269]ETT45152.1 transposase-like protein [Paenibacillus sp. FSL R7-269]
MVDLKVAKLFGILNYETGHVLYRDGERYAPVLIQFLDAVRKSYAKGKIGTIPDNSRIDRAEQVQTYLQKHTQLQFVFLPKYH